MTQNLKHWSNAINSLHDIVNPYVYIVKKCNDLKLPEDQSSGMFSGDKIMTDKVMDSLNIECSYDCTSQHDTFFQPLDLTVNRSVMKRQFITYRISSIRRRPHLVAALEQ